MSGSLWIQVNLAPDGATSSGDIVLEGIDHAEVRRTKHFLRNAMISS